MKYQLTPISMVNVEGQKKKKKWLINAGQNE